jgi:hypothetical protein
MLILPPGHAQAVRRQRPLRAGERRLLGAAGLALVAVIVLVVMLAGGAGATRRGCVSVALAYSTGGEQISRCGPGARSLCGGVGVPGGITGAPGRTVAAACRRAGLPTGSKRRGGA